MANPQKCKKGPYWKSTVFGFIGGRTRVTESTSPVNLPDIYKTDNTKNNTIIPVQRGENESTISQLSCESPRQLITSKSKNKNNTP